MEKQLTQLRKEIDRADSALLTILAKRVEISAIIGTLKKTSGLHPVDRARQKSVLKTRVSAGKKKGLSPTFVMKLFKLIHDESVRIQKDV